MNPLLNRNDFGASRPLAPVRQVHLGLGAFHRAHQAAYTDLCDESSEWGIAGFTGRRPKVARVLAAQDGLYTLVQRGSESDQLRVIGALSQVHDGADVAALAKLVASPETVIVTLTITEAGYCLGLDGNLNLHSGMVGHDYRALQTLRDCSDFEFMDRLRELGLRTSIARLVGALEARRRAHGEPLSIVPCDNLPANGSRVRSIVGTLGVALGEGFLIWAHASVDYVSTSVDRITPATTDRDLKEVTRVTGYQDRAVVVTEAFSDWVLSGSFRRGRPEWEKSGAQFVDSVEPFENRKLWMLNGAHSFLANAGRLRGYQTIAEAVQDTSLVEATNKLWGEAESCLPKDNLRLADYRAALLERFGNARIEHRLEQIATETTTKLALRIVPVALAQLAAGRNAPASAQVLGSWIAAFEIATPANESRYEELAKANSASEFDRSRSFVRLLSQELADNGEFMHDVCQSVIQYQAQQTTTSRSSK
jgi:fructuronate reductase